MSNPYLDRLAKAGKNPHGKKSEKLVAKKMGARLHPNSGAGVAKSDASLRQIQVASRRPDLEFRVEMKSTTTQTMAVEMAWLIKIAHEALDHGQTPCVVVSFVDASGKPRMKHYSEWVLIPIAAFEELAR